MSETMSAPSGGGSAAPAPAPSGAAAPSADVQASGGSGNAPGLAGDATAGAEPAAASSPAVSVGKFRFNGRDWNDQRHAEEAIKAQIGRVPEVQRENAELKRLMAARDAELEALRGVVTSRHGQGAGQGAANGAGNGQSAPQSFADRAVASKDIELLASIAADPEQGGVPAMLYGLLDLVNQEMDAREQRLRSEAIEPINARSQQAQVVARGFSVAKQLVSQGYPEFEDGNQDPAIVEAQNWIVQRLSQFPEGVVASDPEFYMRGAAEEYRRLHGIPVTALPPGTSGSPSSRVAAAAEAAASAGAPSPLDGSGIPRPRPGGNGREGFNDRTRRENQAAMRSVTSEGGRKILLD